MKEREQDKITIRDVLIVLFRWKFIIFFTIILIVIPTYISLELQTPVYKAGVKITFLVPEKFQARPERYIPFSLNLGEINSDRVLARVVRILNLDKIPLDYEMHFSSPIKKWLIEYKANKLKNRIEKLAPEEQELILFKRAIQNLKKDISVSHSEGTVIISAQAFNPTMAVTLANAVTRAYFIADIEFKITGLLRRVGEKNLEIIKLEKTIEELSKYLDGRPAPEIDRILTTNIRVVEDAKVIDYISPEKTSPLVLSFVGSLFLGVVLAFLFEFMFQAFRSRRDIERILNIPFLGYLPRVKRKYRNKLLVEPSPLSCKRHYQQLTNNLDLLRRNKNYKSILVIDMEGADDTAYVIANIGILLARDYNVLIIDANLRKPLISRIFNVPETKKSGLTDLLIGEIVNFEEVLYSWDSNLTILISGHSIPNPPTLLNSETIKEIIKKAKERFDIILIAGAEIKNYTDSIILSSVVDAIVIVINEGRVRVPAAIKAIEPLKDNRFDLIGAILNNRRFEVPDFIYRRL